jgi:purine nucleoside permease
MGRFFKVPIGILLLLGCLACPLQAQKMSKGAHTSPIHVKVVVVAMFEVGEDTGDIPGEYQLWVEREDLDQVLPLPAGYHHVRINKDGVLGLLTGVATAKAAASVMALGLDPRFDLSKAYWVIGGGDPADVSLGSAVWANHVIDGDIGYEIDAREIPTDWPTGFVPLRKSKPYELPVKPKLDGEAYTLNQDLVAWAYQVTKDIPLDDSEAMRVSRARYSEFPNAMKPPFVTRGDTMSGGTFWHAHGRKGQRMDKILHGRAGKFHDRGDGRYGHLAGSDVSGPSGPCRLETRAGAAHREQFRPRAAGRDTRGNTS